jgi:hypothetical protein
MEEGHIGIVYGGIIKAGWIRLFWSDEKMTEEFKYKMVESYGKIQIKFIKTANPRQKFEEIVSPTNEDIYKCLIKLPVQESINLLKQITGIDRIYCVKIF